MHRFAGGDADGLFQRLFRRARAGGSGDAIDFAKECARPEGERVLLLSMRRNVGGGGNCRVVYVAFAVSHSFYRSVRGGFDRFGDLVHGNFAKTGLAHFLNTAAADLNCFGTENRPGGDARATRPELL
jgi:hypothetical protein